MSAIRTDIAIIGAGMAGASLAAFVGDRAQVLLLEGESQPGYHATGRSAAFWSESYGGPGVQPLTTASGPWLAERAMLSPRGCIHIARDAGTLEPLAAELAACGVVHHALDRAALEAAVPGVRPAYPYALAEPTCQDIDVAALHAHLLARARGGGARMLCDAEVQAIVRTDGRWRITTRAGEVDAAVLVNAAGGWADAVARMAGAMPIAIQPYRRTMVQLVTTPAPPAELPLIMDGEGQFYFKPEAGGRVWLSPHDETAVDAHDVAPEELDQALAIDRFEQAVDWRVVRRERAWAGLRSFAPDRLPVYGHDPRRPGFFWCAGQGGFGIQTAPAAAMLAAALLLGESPPPEVAAIDVAAYAPDRFSC